MNKLTSFLLDEQQAYRKGELYHKPLVQLTSSSPPITLWLSTEGFLIRQEKDAKQYLLIEYNPNAPAKLGEYDILQTQRKVSNRYIPFVCKVENLK